MNPKRLVLLLTLACVACTEQKVDNVYSAQIYVFGTVVDIEIAGVSDQRGSELSATIAERFQRMHNDLHAWKPGALDDLNACLKTGQPCPLSPELRDVIARAMELEANSDGLFSPAAGNLVRMWGFHTDRYPIYQPPPQSQAIDRWLGALPNMAQITLGEDTVSASNPNVRLDFGAFAKGVAVDYAIDVLKRADVAGGMVNAGGDLRAFGNKYDRPWRVAVRHPSEGSVQAGLEVTGDEAIFTSGNYARFGEHEGVRYAHILDPRTGRPVSRIASATVVADRGGLADAAATALLVAGPRHWRKIALQMGLRNVLLIDHEGCLYLDSDMLDRLIFPAEVPDCVFESPSLVNKSQ
jgi:thiamine biosynthesis lipoprotein